MSPISLDEARPKISRAGTELYHVKRQQSRFPVSPGRMVWTVHRVLLPIKQLCASVRYKAAESGLPSSGRWRKEAYSGSLSSIRVFLWELFAVWSQTSTPQCSELSTILAQVCSVLLPSHWCLVVCHLCYFVTPIMLLLESKRSASLDRPQNVTKGKIIQQSFYLLVKLPNLPCFVFVSFYSPIHMYTWSFMPKKFLIQRNLYNFVCIDLSFFFFLICRILQKKPSMMTKKSCGNMVLQPASVSLKKEILI